jgi:hypothetical protein
VSSPPHPRPSSSRVVPPLSSHCLALAPHIHPVSSCSWQWCGHPLALLPVYPPLSWSSPFPFVSLPVSCRYRSTHHPPHGQLLVGLGVGGVLFVALGGAGPVSVVGVVLAVIVDPPPSLSSFTFPSSTFLSSSSVHPPSTPWAVACGAGLGGVSFIALDGAGPVSVVWCGVDAGRGVSVFVMGPFLVVVGPWCSFPLSSVGGPLVCPPSSLSLLHPVFTLQAVAHGGGGGCWLSSVLWGLGMGGCLLFIVFLSFPYCCSPVVVPMLFCIGTCCW